jgi:hypothetical protein
MADTSINIAIPNDAEEGDILSFSVKGTILEMAVPVVSYCTLFVVFIIELQRLNAC